MNVAYNEKEHLETIHYGDFSFEFNRVREIDQYMHRNDDRTMYVETLHNVTSHFEIEVTDRMFDTKEIHHIPGKRLSKQVGQMVLDTINLIVMDRYNTRGGYFSGLSTIGGEFFNPEWIV
jgi:hypothetical protein